MRDEADAFASEIAMIDLFGRKDLGTGCLRNFTDGGDGVSGHKHSEASLKRMSEARKGKPSSKKGKKVPPEVRKNMKGLFSKGFVPWNTGKTGGSWSKTRREVFDRTGVSAETRKKISQALLGKPNLKLRGRKFSDETLRRMSKPRSHSWTLPPEKKQERHETAIRREARKKERGMHCGQKFGYIHTEAAKLKMSAAKKGKPSWNKGVKQTPEHLAKLSAVRKGKKWSARRRVDYEAKRKCQISTAYH